MNLDSGVTFRIVGCLWVLHMRTSRGGEVWT
jgi:hypothetical protein